MNLIIKALTPALVDDYLNFFDTVAFCDHEAWAGCYCLFYHTDPAGDATEDTGAWNTAVRRARAERMIWDGELTGYLAYDGEKVVGWCNAGEKRSFCRLRADSSLWFDTEKVKSVVCFTIAPDMRGRGIATALLKKVVEDAAGQGYAFVEGYPVDADRADTFRHYHGHPEMFEKQGFVPVRRLEGRTVVRKRLKE
jgi:GNAT superfamily N-acetyltransferase